MGESFLLPERRAFYVRKILTMQKKKQKKNKKQQQHFPYYLVMLELGLRYSKV